MGNSMETRNEAISEAAVEAAAEAAYEAVRTRMGFPTDFADAPEPLKETYRLMARAALEAGALHLSIDSADSEKLVADARASELEDFAAFIRGPQTLLHDRYTLRKLAGEATTRAENLRKSDR